MTFRISITIHYIISCFSSALDEIKTSEELESLAENFREQASKLVDMLDTSIPVVAKLKVIS